MPSSQDSVDTLNVVQPTVSNSIEQVRYVCSMGAITSLIAIPGVIPITHCGPGCASKQYQSLALMNGYQGGEFHVPSTNLSEKEVVFGGVERLDELIDATLKIMEAELFVVLTGCISHLVGDDVESVINKYRRQGVSIVLAATKGFKGNNFTGHELVVKAIVDQYLPESSADKTQGLVNLWSLLPYQNPFWRGDLTEIKRLLEGIGLKVNVLFGPASAGLQEWKLIPEAQFNLVLSPWLGLDIAEHLETKYGQPFLHVPVVPIGAQESGSFLHKVAEFAGIESEKVEQFIASEEAIYYSYLRDFATFYSGYTTQYQLPSHSVVIGESAYSLALCTFLANQLGILPAKVVLTENPPENVRKAIRKQFRAISTDFSTEVEFTEDGYVAQQFVRNLDFSAKVPVIYGSTWEAELAKSLNASLIEISFPCTDEVVLSRTYVGYRGALALIERTFTMVVRASTQS